MNIINVPSVYFVHLPAGRWVNLAQIRSLQVLAPGKLAVAWTNGTSEIFSNDSALTLLKAVEESHAIARRHLDRLSQI